jgi:8-oxo-dGTP pyrophosphatase MutT (NUDIX family)
MYKVFVNDLPIIFTQNNKISTSLKVVNFKVVKIKKLVKALFNEELNGICLICSNVDADFKSFISKFKIQKAAGGKVENLGKEVLFIYRFNKWDLPKGKLEEEESIMECAIREVEEECGISNLVIQDQLETTYHMFQRKNKTIFKITYWYLMNTTYAGNLVPQIEEGIEKVVFKNEIEIEEALKNTYENIKLLF